MEIKKQFTKSTQLKNSNYSNCIINQLLKKS